jgi:hypothetical protein
MPTSGSSPRVRRPPHVRIVAAVFGRLIPACAETAPPLPALTGRSTAHPRVCGDRDTTAPFLSAGAGSSPRVRRPLFREETDFFTISNSKGRYRQVANSGLVLGTERNKAEPVEMRSGQRSCHCAGARRNNIRPQPKALARPKPQRSRFMNASGAATSSKPCRSNTPIRAGLPRRGNTSAR